MPKRDLLIVEDDPNLRHMLRYLFADEGFVILEAADGATALTMLETNPHPCIVLLDLQLPIMSGIELLEKLSADPTMTPLLQRHKFIIQTATPHLAETSIGLVISAWNIPVLPKPIRLDQLRKAVTAASSLEPGDEQKA